MNYDEEEEMIEYYHKLRKQVSEIQTETLNNIIEIIKECSENYVIFPEDKKYYSTDELLNKIYERYPYLKDEFKK